MSHTPGPWTYEREETAMQEFRGYSVSVVREGIGERVLIPPEAINREADARLIAAAPDLLAALEGFTFSLDYDDGQHDYVLHAHASYVEAENARAAIAKAKGEA